VRRQTADLRFRLRRSSRRHWFDRRRRWSLRDGTRCGARLGRLVAHGLRALGGLAHTSFARLLQPARHRKRNGATSGPHRCNRRRLGRCGRRRGHHRRRWTLAPWRGDLGARGGGRLHRGRCRTLHGRRAWHVGVAARLGAEQLTRFVAHHLRVEGLVDVRVRLRTFAGVERVLLRRQHQDGHARGRQFDGAAKLVTVVGAECDIGDDQGGAQCFDLFERRIGAVACHDFVFSALERDFEALPHGRAVVYGQDGAQGSAPRSEILAV